MASVQPGVEAFDVAVGKALPTRMTEEEFVARCDEDIRAEWIDGEMVIMSPASIVHNRLSRCLLSLLEDYVAERELGEAFGTDFSVRLPAKRRRLPDVLFVARDRSHCLRENHCEGAPNLIMEVVSDESVDRDWRVKYLEYEAPIGSMSRLVSRFQWFQPITSLGAQTSGIIER